MKYPKIYMDRGNHASQVVVNNEHDEAQLPSNWVPLDGTPSGATGATPGRDLEKADTEIKGATGKANALAEQQADLDQRRKDFDRDVDAFAKHVRDQQEELTQLRAQLDIEADKMAQERKQLDEDKAYAEQAKAQALNAQKDPGAAAAAEVAKAAEAPAKRTRTARD